MPAFLVPVMAWFGGLSTKMIAIGFAALIVVGVILGGVYYASSTRNQLMKVSAQLAQESVLKQAAIARADDIMTQHALQTERIETLEAQRTAIAVEAIDLRAAIAKMDLEQDIASDTPDRAAANLNARNVELNGLLERASGRARVIRADPGAGSKAVPADTHSSIRRALAALRGKAVPHAGPSAKKPAK